ncbi:MAG: phosphatidate cytidylyltransferase [Clostridia bacterium]|nr:phosphatidate cytidylyltransferase [Clostridia bacterium]
MRKRIISGVTGALFAVFILFFGQSHPMIINLITALIAALAANEMFAVMGISKIWIISVPSLIFCAFLPAFGYGIYWYILWYVYSLWIFCTMILKPTLTLKQIVMCYAATILISVSFSCMILLRDFGKRYGCFFVLLALCIAWLSDTGAYFCGKFFGKNKLCPEISPKKTVEGFFGGISVSVLSTLLAAAIFDLFTSPENIQINYFQITVMALIGALISVLGDLCFSAIKRKCGVKDFGSLMPGHGGILDRFDSVIFVVPYVYIFVQIIPIMIKR